MTRRQAALGIGLFAAATIASVAVALAALTWRLIAGVPAAMPAPIAAAPGAEVDVAPILAQAPFGGSAMGAPSATGLPIELRGLILSTAPRASAALIAPTGGSAVSYAIGQAIPGGAILETIGVDHVILAVGGHRELLAFPRHDAAAGTAAGAPPIPGGAGPILPPGSISAAPPPPPGGTLGPSPQSILDGLGATPMPNGYRIGDGMAPSYRQTGLQPGDVIEQVNGNKLGNPATDQQLLASALRAGIVRIDLLRGDRHLTLSFQVR